MIMAIMSFIVVASIAYYWLMKGFFSALVHLACVIGAGAIAFGVWEPVSYFLLDMAPARGTMAVLADVAWGLGLALPFAVSLALLRVAVDACLPANAQCENVVDYIGGGICGTASGVITAGILVLSVGFLRLGPDLWGYQAVGYSEQRALGPGSIERKKNILVPWDHWTAALYERLSLTTLRTNDPLAKWHPGLADEPAALRMTNQDRGRNTVTPKDFSVVGWYTVGMSAGYNGGDLTAVMTDSWNPLPQKVVDLNGEPIARGYLAGFVINFNSGAKEKQGQVVVGNGQMRLVCESIEEEEWIAVHPVAVVTNVDDPEKVEFARFRYDSNNVYIASVGGASNAIMGFEFPVPSGYRPLALYIKGVRHEVDEGVPSNFADPSARDAAIQSGAENFFTQGGGLTVGEINTAGSETINPGNTQGGANPGIELSNAMGIVLQKGTEQGLRAEPSESGRGYTVVDGDQVLKRSAVGRGAGIDAKLRVDRFAVTPDIVVVKVDVSANSKSSLLSPTALASDFAHPPILVDTEGREYPAVGWVYLDEERAHIRYTVGQPLRAMTEAPGLSRSRPQQDLRLVFRVNFGAKIARFQIGPQVIAEYSPPVHANTRQK